MTNSRPQEPEPSSFPTERGGLPLKAFDVGLFRESSETTVAKLEKHLADLSIKGLALTEPSALSRAARALMTTEQENIAGYDEEKLGAIIDLYVKTGIQVQSPGYMGRQFSSTVPLAGVIDFVSSVVNQPSSFYEAGQLPNVVEKIMADELNRFIGWPPGTFAMVTTSGGSLANLTAMLAARNDKFPGFWSEGSAAFLGQERPAIAVGDDVHYSVTRTAGVMGIGEAQIVRLPLNHAQQIDMNRVRPALEAAEGRGLRVFCLVASAGAMYMVDNSYTGSGQGTSALETVCKQGQVLNWIIRPIDMERRRDGTWPPMPKINNIVFLDTEVGDEEDVAEKKVCIELKIYGAPDRMRDPFTPVYYYWAGTVLSTAKPGLYRYRLVVELEQEGKKERLYLNTENHPAIRVVPVQ
ncbi:Pyridoxal-dependent decarboxylase conserved domain-containing protein [Nonomuraea solani]|uniref:Pyridoxal-dependent decarboxylase conserved domain-containing protein n=1 Tax=Nonomuraea solani TaxID=1144553 RepID=A0A1H5VK38_9ACTN|nr:pyridoxal-dependent decarboxylase [Nonomuraea solani]SEF86917.1 Pyridoxal-dependent decarboxylase conserved domain-containing protein [Nonomuraea solani]